MQKSLALLGAVMLTFAFNGCCCHHFRGNQCGPCQGGAYYGGAPAQSFAPTQSPCDPCQGGCGVGGPYGQVGPAYPGTASIQTTPTASITPGPTYATAPTTYKVSAASPVIMNGPVAATPIQYRATAATPAQYRTAYAPTQPLPTW